MTSNPTLFCLFNWFWYWHPRSTFTHLLAIKHYYILVFSIKTNWLYLYAIHSYNAAEILERRYPSSFTCLLIRPSSSRASAWPSIKASAHSVLPHCWLHKYTSFNYLKCVCHLIPIYLNTMTRIFILFTTVSPAFMSIKMAYNTFLRLNKLPTVVKNIIKKKSKSTKYAKSCDPLALSVEGFRFIKHVLRGRTN